MHFSELLSSHKQLIMIRTTISLLVLCFITNIERINAISEDCIYYPNCSSTMDCNQPESCISNYDLLESYIQTNKSLIGDLAQAFYRTGHSPARFVRITYKFQIPLRLNNESNETDSFIEDNGCSSVDRLYYWSTSPIYLLGPKPLTFLSLFAIFVQEENVTIQLPCLQANNQRALLSRLTYLVCK